MKLLLALLFFVLLVPAQAQPQLTIRNRIFKGAVSGEGDQMMVGLQALVEAVGGKIKQQDGTWVVTRGDAPEGAAAAEGAAVLVEGQPVESSTGEPIMVNFQQFAAAYGLQARLDKDLLIVSVLPKGSKPAEQAATAGEGPDLIVNGNFREGPSGGEKNPVTAGSKEFPGWTALTAGPWRGPNFIHLTGLSAITQEIYTVPGQDYMLRVLWYAKKKSGNSLEVTLGEVKDVWPALDGTMAGTLPFRATGPVTVLKFRATYPQKGQHAVSLLKVTLNATTPKP